MAGFVDGLGELPGIVVCVVGTMGDQGESERNPQAAALVMRTNYEGPALILGLFAERMAARGNGALVGVSSVAGDRGRATNYVYGSAKAGFTAFLSGLRNRLAKQGVHVVTVKPGFVATRMTEGMDLPGALVASPEEVAEAVHRAVARHRDVIYVRLVWWPLMSVIRAIPERIFKRLKL
jgi:short-subunit dehydrogenase